MYQIINICIWKFSNIKAQFKKTITLLNYLIAIANFKEVNFITLNILKEH